ncbi:NAD-dependent malic enzyme [Paenibacillus kyungheensis]|uniref:NAD-dependent malic enzyme n=1 Tax=Paenibacillus kyungheensis TaxID=1452732 RepID=A0AAX3M5M3_9BACL|nr:NAD-dependent malic enzyme [Paenibacillus kyungheensis]WCT56751.1 NAD-dependent malic enzyme [Paenibacillus kyungheensis]
MALGTSMIIRLEMDKKQVTFGEVAAAISDAGGDVVAIDVIHASPESTTRDLTVNLPETVRESILKSVGELSGVKVVNVSDRTFLAHLGGKIEVQPKFPVKNREDLSHVYTPGVAKVCMAIHEDKQKAFSLTIKRNMIAVVSDGTAVLGLGDIGPEAAMPVMEGKAMLFKQLGGVDAFPICLDTKDTEEIINAIKWMAPSFGGINLEDIASPRCFEIERRLTEELDIPVFHDDQHGTAVVVLAGLLNALRIVDKPLENAKIVLLGVGAAGSACIKMLLSAGAHNVIAVDQCGALVSGEEYPHDMWNWIAEHTNPYQERGGLTEVIQGADVFIGVSRPGLLTVEHIQSMAEDRIVFAMANPNPEIEPELAEPHVRVLATGRSDYPNQINNVLCFPGIFRGALDCRASVINEEMKVAAAKAIASVVKEDELNELYIIPGVFNEKVVEYVRRGVVEAAIRTGVARRTPPEFR